MNYIAKNGNTVNAVKQGNAGERPDADCGILRLRAATVKCRCCFLSQSGIPKADKPLAAVRLQVCPQRILQTENMQVPSRGQALSISLRSLSHSYISLCVLNRPSGRSTLF